MTESTDTTKVICKEEFEKCWKAIPYDFGKEKNSDSDGGKTEVGKEFVIAFRSTDLIG